ncbi:hypothetical protein Pdw03_3067 [Penicillium digitatum]|uniref:Uncharacterized protein n=1 Tax=Penicillium digitatum TaxID=36651 RepID=A0A7T6XFK0_PENDI|nr:hypothetical protein Pdw03_3067 [Penicillium digitatum]
MTLTGLKWALLQYKIYTTNASYARQGPWLCAQPKSNRERHHSPPVDATLMDQHSGLPLVSRQWIKGALLTLTVLIFYHVSNTVNLLKIHRS